MNARLNKSITLLELLIAITLLSVIVLGFASIDLFSRFHVFTSDRRAKVQNEASYVLEHMSKEIIKAIGNTVISGQEPIEIINNPNDKTIKAYIDASGNGYRETPVNNPLPTQDHWIAYRLDLTGNNRYQIRFCGRCFNPNCNFNQCLDTVDILSTKITDFYPTREDNYLNIRLTSCSEPTLNTCGSTDNPNVTMQNRIKMPSVATH